MLDQTREAFFSQIKKYLQDENALLKVVFSGKQKNMENPWIRVTLRPIILKGKHFIQFSYYDEKKCIVKNYAGKEYTGELQKLFATSFKNISVESTLGSLQLQTSKKGKVFVHEKAPSQTKEDVNLAHNKSKKYLIPDNVASDFLEAVGIMTKEGKVKSEKQIKFRQLNGFLKIIDETFTKARKSLEFKNDQLLAVDCGCGNAYLTFATYDYFNYIVGKPLEMIGVDINKELIENHQQEIEKLRWDKLKFEATKIIDYTPPSNPDIVLSLHACDTATDEALFKAITWESKMVFASPCCHHNIQMQLEKEKNLLKDYAPLLRHGALSERLGDVLTDSFRALILRITGYQTDVIEFVDSENTHRNLIIRAIKYLQPGDKKTVEEYKKLKDIWHVTPHLEKLLGENLTKYLSQNYLSTTTGNTNG